MYNSNFICTYSFYDTELRECYHKDEKYDIKDVEEFEEMSEIIYQAELLQVLGLSKEFNANINIDIDIEFNSEKIITIYNKIKTNPSFMKCIEKVMNNNSYKDLETAFIALLSYHYFFLTHKCICNFLNTGKILDINIQNLNNALK